MVVSAFFSMLAVSLLVKGADLGMVEVASSIIAIAFTEGKVSAHRFIFFP